MTERKINFGINDGNEFYAHESSVNFTPLQFVLDFRCVTPRIDARSNEGPYISMKHNVIMLDPYHVKEFCSMLAQLIERYEKEYGKIKKPKALEKAQGKMAQEGKKKEEGPTYFG